MWGRKRLHEQLLHYSRWSAQWQMRYIPRTHWSFLQLCEPNHLPALLFPVPHVSENAFLVASVHQPPDCVSRSCGGNTGTFDLCFSYGDMPPCTCDKAQRCRTMHNTLHVIDKVCR